MFEDALSVLIVSDLKDRIPLLDTQERPSRKADIIELIKRHMLSLNIDDYWVKLDFLEQQAVAEAVYNWDGLFIAERFSNKYSAVPAFFIRRRSVYGQTAKQDKSSRLALFFYQNKIPAQLITGLKQFVKPPQANRLTTVSAEAISAMVVTVDDVPLKPRLLSMEAVVQQELTTMLRLVESGKVSVSDKTGQATAASIKAIDALLVGGDFYTPDDDKELEKYSGGSIRPIRSFAWPLLLQSGGLAKRNGRKLELTRKGQKALTEPLMDTVQLLYKRWRDKGLLDEYRRIDLVKGQNGKGRRMADVVARRDVIEEILLECPVGEWLKVDELFRYVKAEGFELEITHDSYKHYFCDSNYGALDDSFEIFQGRYLLVYLFEYLATLGLIDVAYIPPYSARGDFSKYWGADDFYFLSRYDGLLYLRLNSLGAYALNMCDGYEPIEPTIEPLLEVDEQLSIHLIREPVANEILMLEQYAEPLQMGKCQITFESLLNALEKGKEPALFLDFLEKYSTQSLNDEVASLFSELEIRASAFEGVSAAQLITCTDAKLARMLSSDSRTKNHCQWLGGATLVVPDKSEREFSKNLKKMGYVLPARS